MGRINHRAVFKVVFVVLWIVLCGIIIPAKTEIHSFPASWLITEWGKDVQNFSQNVTLWNELSPMGQRLYYLIPMAYILAFLGWFFFVFRLHRKSLYVNGAKEGTVIWIHGHPRGHIYDIQCVLYNRCRHFDRMQDVYRPISGMFMVNDLLVYYRPGWFHNPLEYIRAVVNPVNIYTYSVQAIAPVDRGVTMSQYRNRLVDLDRSYLVYVDLRLDPSYKSTTIKKDIFDERHREQQAEILRNTWRMGRAEPGTALRIIANSSYAIPDRTLRSQWEKLPEPEKKRIKEVWDAKDP